MEEPGAWIASGLVGEVDHTRESLNTPFLKLQKKRSALMANRFIWRVRIHSDFKDLGPEDIGQREQNKGTERDALNDHNDA